MKQAMNPTPIPKRVSAFLLCLALLVGLLPVTASAVEDVTYIDASGVTQTVRAGDYTAVSKEDSYWGNDGRTTWYVVKESMTIDGGVYTVGNVNLILMDEVTLTVKNNSTSPAIQIQGSLTVYGQTAGSGILEVSHSDNLGNCIQVDSDGGVLTVNSGTVTATSSGQSCITGNLTVNGGIVKATSSNSAGYGIFVSDGDTLAISGGEVNATSTSSSGAGIFVSYNATLEISGGTVNASGDTGINIEGNKTATIRGGTVNAMGTSSGYNCCGIGVGRGANVNITGGMVNATAENESRGIYSTAGNINPNIPVTGGTLNARGASALGTPTLNLTISGDGKAVITGTIGQNTAVTSTGGGTLTIPDGETVTLDSNSKGITVGPDGKIELLGSINGKQPTYQSSVEVSVEPSSVTVGAGSTVTLKATIKTAYPGFPNGRTVTFSTGSTNLAENIEITGSDGTYTATVTDVSVDGLTAGQHTITAAFTNNAITANTNTAGLTVTSTTTATLSVKSTQTTPPSAPQMSQVTESSITLQTQTGGQNGVEYGYVEGTTGGTPESWQNDTTFTDLSAGTAYTFYARYKGNESYEPSEPSDGTTIYTAPRIDTIDLTGATVGSSYSYQLTSTPSTGVTWTATGLPDDLSFSSSGLISGTPTAVTTTDLTITVTATVQGTDYAKSEKQLTLSVGQGTLGTPSLTLSSSGPGSLKASWGAVSNATGGYTVQLDNGTAVDPNGQDGTSHTFDISQAGTYTVTVTALDSSGNYTSSSASESLTFYTVIFNPENGSTSTTQIVAHGSKATQPTSDPNKTGYTFANWYKGNDQFDFNTGITTNTTLTAHWTLNAPSSVTVSPTSANETYNHGQTVVTLPADPSHALTSGVTYSYQWYHNTQKLSGATSRTLNLTDVDDSGSYYVEVTATVSGETSIAKQSDSVTVTISKATPRYTTPTGLEATYGDTLADVQLPTATNGAWAWKSSALSVGDVGSNPFTAVFTPTDGENYTTAEVTVYIQVAAAQIQGSVTISGNAVFGQELEAVYTGDETVTYAWYRRDGTDVIGTDKTYTLTAADVDQTIRVEVSGTGNYTGTVEVSTGPVEKATGSISISCADVVYGNTPNPSVTSTTNIGATVTYTYEGTSSTTYGSSTTAPTNVGTYTVTAKVAATATHKEATSDPVEFSITQSGSALSVSAPDSVTYGDNLTITVTVQSGSGGTITTATGTVTLTNADGTELASSSSPQSGVYTLTYATAGKGLAVGGNDLTIAYSGDANVDSSSGIASVTLAQKSITASITGTTSKTYDGTAAAPGATIILNDVLSGDTVEAVGTPTYDSPDVTGAKTISATVGLSGAHASWYTLASGTVSVGGTITAKDIGKATITLDALSLVYTGNELTQAVSSVMIDNLTVTYDVSGNQQTNAGKYQLTVEGTGNFTGTKTAEWSIAQATNEWTTDLSITGWTYGQTANKPTAGAKFGAVEITYSDSEKGTFTDAVPTAAGTWYVKATVAGTTDYTSLEAVKEFEITKADATLSVSAAQDLTYNGAAQALMTAATAPEGTTLYYAVMTTTGAPDDSAYDTAIPTREDAGTYYVWYKLTGGNNYNDMTADYVTVAIDPMTVVLAWSGHENLIYDGNAKNVTATVSNLVEDAACTVTVEGGKETTAGTHTATATSLSNSNYTLTGCENSTQQYIIAKAPVTLGLTASPESLRGRGAVTLTLTGLPSEGSATVTCDDSSITLSAGTDNTWTATLPNQTKTYTFTASYAESDNYEAATASCQVSVTHRSSGGSTTPSRPSTTESATGESGGWEEIGTEIEEAQPGDTIVVDMNGTTEVPAEIFEEVAGKDVTVEFDLGGGISWTVNGQDVPTGTSFQSLNLGVDMGTSGISVNVINNITGEYGSVQVTLAHDGEFGFTLTLTAPLGSDNAGHWANLYYYHEDSEELTFQTSGRIGADGSVSLRFTHASQYAIVIDDYNHGAGELPFTDVVESAWYYDAVSYVYTEGLMAGTSGTTFSPDITTSRAMIAVILWRLEGSPATSEYTDFSDVADGVWYAEGVRWASSVGVVGGYPNGSFGPNDPITREQMAAMLYRYADYKGCDVTDLADLSAFTDAEDISGYAVTALRWANAAGIVGGYGDGTLRPQGNARRSEAAAMLMRFCENLTK